MNITEPVYFFPQLSLDEDDASNIDGFYVGYKINASPDPYTFIPVDKSHKSEVQSYELTSLNRFTEYSFIIQAYNKRGAGPPSETTSVRTLEFGKFLFCYPVN
ncbi:down syndrome cell adhesion molecule-like protein Dscam2 [Caerostris darwini]|uniref:Down syndrome cell adhesion molecule-like protein Dscam2 n=1 Tax=Caerostris darwini TaxID=1538125 RepID=A0AAV4N5D5_9ARAC|nr:down syndrome cell adhesion molecule-like protein Dscam2 [Caerostris darwini]